MTKIHKRRYEWKRFKNNVENIPILEIVFLTLNAIGNAGDGVELTNLMVHQAMKVKWLQKCHKTKVLRRNFQAKTSKLGTVLSKKCNAI